LIEREDVAFIHQVDHGRSVAGLEPLGFAALGPVRIWIRR
jgi:hypothetical protein